MGEFVYYLAGCVIGGLIAALMVYEWQHGILEHEREEHEQAFWDAYRAKLLKEEGIEEAPYVQQE